MSASERRVIYKCASCQGHRFESLGAAARGQPTRPVLRLIVNNN